MSDGIQTVGYDFGQRVTTSKLSTLDHEQCFQDSSAYTILTDATIFLQEGNTETDLKVCLSGFVNARKDQEVKCR